MGFSVSVSVSGLGQSRPDLIVERQDFPRLVDLCAAHFNLQPETVTAVSVEDSGQPISLYPASAVPAMLKLAERSAAAHGGDRAHLRLWISALSNSKQITIPGSAGPLGPADIFLGARILALAKLGTPMAIFALVYKLSNNGKDFITQQGFEAGIRDALPGSTLSKVDRVLLSSFFTTLFELLGQQPQAGGSELQAHHLDLFLALLPVAEGSKGEKLGDAWRLLANSELEALPKRQVWRLFRSFLSCFRALTDCMAAQHHQQQYLQQHGRTGKMSPFFQEMKQTVEDSALEAVNAVFLIASATTSTSEAAGVETSGKVLKKITLGQLAEVYNGAFEASMSLASGAGLSSAASSVASSDYGSVDQTAAAILRQLGWFELLDAKKWPVVPLLGVRGSSGLPHSSRAGSSEPSAKHESASSAQLELPAAVIDATRRTAAAARGDVSAAAPLAAPVAPPPLPTPGFSYAAMARKAVTDQDRADAKRREELILQAEAKGLDASTVAEKQQHELDEEAGANAPELEDEEDADILPASRRGDGGQLTDALANEDNDGGRGIAEDSDDDTYEAEKFSASSSARDASAPADEEAGERRHLRREVADEQAQLGSLDSTSSSFDSFPASGGVGGAADDDQRDAEGFPSSFRRGAVLLSLEVVPASDLPHAEAVDHQGSEEASQEEEEVKKEGISLSFAEEDIMSLALFRRLTALDASSHLNGVKAAALASAIALGRRAKLLPGISSQPASYEEEDAEAGAAVGTGGFHHGVTIASTISSTAHGAGTEEEGTNQSLDGIGAACFPTSQDLRSIAMNPEASLANGGLGDVSLGALDIEAIVAGLFPVARLSDQQLAACLKIVYALASILSPRTLVPKKHHSSHHYDGRAPLEGQFSSASSMTSMSSGDFTVNPSADDEESVEGRGSLQDGRGGQMSAAKLLWRPRVPAVDLAAALLCLSSGSKSEKLATLFALYGVKHSSEGTPGDEPLLSRTGLYSAFRPALAALLITSNGVLARLVASDNSQSGAPSDAAAASGLTVSELRSLSAFVELGAVHAAASVVVGVQMMADQQRNIKMRLSGDGKPLVSFNDLSLYYNEGGGSSDLPWLELLDLSKLEAVLLASSVPSATSTDSSLPKAHATSLPPPTVLKSRSGPSTLQEVQAEQHDVPQFRPAEPMDAVYLAHVQGAPTVFRMPLLSSIGGKNALAAPPSEEDDNEAGDGEGGAGVGADAEDDKDAERDFILLGYGSVAFIEYASESSGLNKLSPSEMHAMARKAFDPQALPQRLDEYNFLRLLRGILDASALGGSAAIAGSAAASPNSKAQAAARAIASQRTLLSRFLLRLFKALDYAGVGTAASIDVLIALSALTRGSKSDKLSYAFSLLGTSPSASNSSGPILRRGQLFRFLRNVFVFLSLAQEVGAELDLMALAGAREEAKAKEIRDKLREQEYFGVEGGAYLDDDMEAEEGEQTGGAYNDEESGNGASDPMRSALLSPQRKRKPSSRSAAARTRAAHQAYASSLASSSQASSVITGPDEGDINADLRARARIRSAKQRLRLVTQAANAHAGAILAGAYSAALAVAEQTLNKGGSTQQLPLEVHERGRAVTLLGMARFYNQAGGFSLSPYLELLSVSKWTLPEVGPTASQATSMSRADPGNVSNAAHYAEVARQATMAGIEEAAASVKAEGARAGHFRRGLPSGNDIVFSFSLEPSSSTQGSETASSRLNVSVGACITVYRLAQASGFSLLTPSSLIRVIRAVWGRQSDQSDETGSTSPVASASFSSGRLITRQDFRSLCDAVARVSAALRGSKGNTPASSLLENNEVAARFGSLQQADSEEEQQWCSGMLDILFDCFATHVYPRDPASSSTEDNEEEDEDGDEMAADAAELAVALSLLTSGSKSEKLAALWGHLCEGIAARRASVAADSASKEAAKFLVSQKKQMFGDASSVDDADATASVEEAAIEAGAEAAEAAAAVIVGESALPVSEIAVLLKGAVSALAILCTAADSASASSSSADAAASFSTLVDERLQASQNVAQYVAMSFGLASMTGGSAILDQEASRSMKATHHDDTASKSDNDEGDETGSLLYDVVTALVPYRSFAAWYNQHVSSRSEKDKDDADVSWLELLDLSKWSAWLPSRTFDRELSDQGLTKAASEDGADQVEGEEVKDSSFDYAEEALSNTSSALTADDAFAHEEGAETTGQASAVPPRSAMLSRDTPIFRFALPGFSSDANSNEGLAFNVLVTLADVQRLLTLAQLFKTEQRSAAEVFVAFATKEAEALDRIPEERDEDNEDEDGSGRDEEGLMKADAYLGAAAEAFELADASDAAFRFAAGCLLGIYECFGYQELEDNPGQYAPVSQASALLPPPTSLDLAAAISILAHGNKSEKLGLAWRLFTSDGNNATISQREKGVPKMLGQAEEDYCLDATQLARLFRSFLASVVGLSSLQERVSTGATGTTVRGLDEVEASGPIALASVEAAHAVVAFAEKVRQQSVQNEVAASQATRKGHGAYSATSPLSGGPSTGASAVWPRGLVPFSVFKAWYNGQADATSGDRGHNSIPFIELLSLTKWIDAAESVLSSPPAAAVTSQGGSDSQADAVALAKAKAKASSDADAHVAALMAKALDLQVEPGLSPSVQAAEERLSAAEAAFERALAAVDDDGYHAIEARKAASTPSSSSSSQPGKTADAYRRYVQAAISEAAAVEAAADAAASQAQLDQRSLGGGSIQTGSTNTSAWTSAGADHHTHQDNGMTEEGPAPVFGFILSSEGHLVRVTARDVLAYHYFRSKSGLSHVEPSSVYEFLIRLAEDQVTANNGALPLASAFGPSLTALEFQAAVKILGDAAKPLGQKGPGNDQDDDEDDDKDDPVLDVLQFVFDILACGYNAPHRAVPGRHGSDSFESARVIAPSERRVPAVALAAAVACFAAGGKSTKLALAYKAFEASSTGSSRTSGSNKFSSILDAAELGKGLEKTAFSAFLMSLLVPVLVFGMVEPAESSSSPSPSIIAAAGGSTAAASLYRVAADCAGEISYALLEAQGESAIGQPRLSFAGFADRYNLSLWTLLGWLELLTPSKWDASHKGNLNETAVAASPSINEKTGDVSQPYHYDDGAESDEGLAHNLAASEGLVRPDQAEPADDATSNQGYESDGLRGGASNEQPAHPVPSAPSATASTNPAAAAGELVLDIGLLVRLGSSPSAAQYALLDQLSSSSSPGAAALRLTTADAAHIGRLMKLTNFHLLPIKAIVDAVQAAAHGRASRLRQELQEQSAASVEKQGSAALMRAVASVSEDLLDKKAFNLAVRTLLDQASVTSEFSADSLSQGQRDYLSFSLSSVFFALEEVASPLPQEGSPEGTSSISTGGNGLVRAAEAVAALALLASGNKAAKLSHAWAMFDEDGDGLLSPGEITRLLRSFLACLLALREPPLVSLLTSSRPGGISASIDGGIQDDDIFSVYEDPVAVSLSARATVSARVKRHDDGEDEEDDWDEEDTRLTVIDAVAVRRLASACAFGVVEAWNRQHKHEQKPLISLAFISDFYNSAEAAGSASPNGSASLRWFELLQLGKWVPLAAPSPPLQPPPNRSDAEKGSASLNSSFASAPTGSDRSSIIGDLLQGALQSTGVDSSAASSALGHAPHRGVYGDPLHHALLPRSSNVTSTASSVVDEGVPSSSSSSASSSAGRGAWYYTPQDVRRVLSLSHSTGLATLDAAQVGSTALAMARKEASQVITQTITRGQKEGDGNVQVQDQIDGSYLMSQQTFKSLLRKLLPGVASLQPQERLTISASLLSLYTSLQHGLQEAEGLPLSSVAISRSPNANDATSPYDDQSVVLLPERVPAAAVAACLSLLAGGSKSNKLAALFAAFDADLDGALTQRQLAMLLASVLLGLLGIRRGCAIGDAQEEQAQQTALEISMAQTEALRTGERLAAEAFDWIAEQGSSAGVSLGKAQGRGGNDDEEGEVSVVSFPAFAAMYNAAGYPSLAFLELLNLDKLSTSTTGVAAAGDSLQ